MKSTARLMGHPIHPMLIPYPFAFLSGAAAFDVAAAVSGNEQLGHTGRHLVTAGIVTALGAAIPGAIDYATTVPKGRPKQTATVHMLSNLSALACFAAARARRGDAAASRGTLALELAGTLLLGIGGWLGGSLSYHHQVGVDPEETPERSHARRFDDRAASAGLLGASL